MKEDKKIHKTLHRKLKTEQKEPNQKLVVIPGALYSNHQWHPLYYL